MTGGRRSRDKGNRAERAVVRFLQDRGFAAERIPLSGSAGGKFAGDIRAEASVAGGYVSPRSAPAGRLPGSGEFDDQIPF